MERNNNIEKDFKTMEILTKNSESYIFIDKQIHSQYDLPFFEKPFKIINEQYSWLNQKSWKKQLSHRSKY